MCSFSIASSGKRCLLETSAMNDGNMKFQCKTSEAVVKNMAEWIESDECVSSCGVDRKSVGISSDFLMEPHFTAKLCSSACYQNCPNIVDLYYHLALGEGTLVAFSLIIQSWWILIPYSSKLVIHLGSLYMQLVSIDCPFWTAYNQDPKLIHNYLLF